MISGDCLGAPLTVLLKSHRCSHMLSGLKEHLRYTLLPEVNSLMLVYLSAEDAACCDAVSLSWRADGIHAWRKRCELLNVEVCAADPKRRCAEALRAARESLQFRVLGECQLFGDRVCPSTGKPFLSFIGSPSSGRRFTAIKVFFRWSACCHLGVMEASCQSMSSVKEIVDANLWSVRARPPSRFEDGKLAIEGLNETRVDIRLTPQRGSFVHHEREGLRQATFGILLDHGRVSFFMQSQSGSWSTTGVVAESAAALVPFVASPIQEVQILNIIEAPEVPALRHETAIQRFSAD